MKYSKEERMDIGRRTYNNEFTKHEAMEKYGITETTVDNYIRLYRTENNLPPRGCCSNPLKSRAVLSPSQTVYAEFDTMTREELIGEIIKARINEARAKKGYTVKGDGTEKVFEPIVNRNTKS